MRFVQIEVFTSNAVGNAESRGKRFINKSHVAMITSSNIVKGYSQIDIGWGHSSTDFLVLGSPAEVAKLFE